jgi:hypothetical protein
MALNPVDKSRVNEGLTGVFQDTRTGIFFDPSSDAFLALMEDNAHKTGGGRYLSVQVMGEGNVNTAGAMLSAGGRPIFDELQLEMVTEYLRGQITEDAIDSANSKDAANGAFDLAHATMKVHVQRAQRNMAVDLQGKGWGSMAGIYAVTTGAAGVITVGMPDGTSAAAVPELAKRFKVGDELFAANDEASSTMRGTVVTGDPTRSQDVAIITSINYATGVLTCDTVPTSFLVGDYIGRQGNRYHDATNGRLKGLGLEAWLPPEVATDSIGGKSRSGRPDLQPIRFDANSMAIKDALIEADEFHFNMDKPREGLACLTTTKVIRQLNVKQEALKVVQITRPERGSSKGDVITISVGAYELQGCDGQIIPIMSSKFVRPKTAFFGPFKSKEYNFVFNHSTDDIVEWNKENGEMLRYVQGGVLDGLSVTVPGYEFNGRIRYQPSCKHAGAYMVINNLDESA